MWGGKMVNVEAEVNKHKNCKDRGELGRLIKEYKALALQHAKDIIAVGQYNMVAHKLQEICDKLPAPHIKNIGGTHGAPVKTATISKGEQAQINADWKQKAKS
ncbi:MAG: hypothetical protein LBH44_03615 [Treponema sp.]|jgi:hypothetical protein|nr:hypothetical protein [Treponema sp.]